jgi:SSS family solute:Na+ symporter
MPDGVTPVIPEGTSPNAVLGMMVGKLATPIIGGLVTAGIMAAIMSSLDSQFVAVGTMFTKDIVVHFFGIDRFSEKQKVLLARGHMHHRFRNVPVYVGRTEIGVLSWDMVF